MTQVPGMLRDKQVMEQYLRQTLSKHCPLPPWLRRIGLAGFLFFLIKGILWLVVPGLLLTSAL